MIEICKDLSDERLSETETTDLIHSLSFLRKKCLSNGLIDHREILNTLDRLLSFTLYHFTSLLQRRSLTAFWRGYLEDDFLVGGKS